MKTKILVLLFIFGLFGAVSADVGVVVEFPDGSTFTKCIRTNDGESTYEIMQNTNLDIVWGGPHPVYGHSLCKIESIGTDPTPGGCEYGGEYWGFQLALDGASSWGYSPVGFDAGDCWNRDFSSFEGHYCAKHGDVLGFAYGSFGVQPDFFSFSEICPSSDKPSSDKRHKIEITKIEPKNPVVVAGESLELRVTVENKGKYDEVVKLGSRLPEGCSLENETKVNLTRREKDISLNLNLITKPDTTPGKYVSFLIADCGSDDDRKTFILEILPLKSKPSEQSIELEENPLPEVDTSSEDSISETETKLKKILYEYEPKILKSLDDKVTIHLYYMGSGGAIDLADVEVRVNKLLQRTDNTGTIFFEPTLRQDTLLEVEKEGFEDLQVIFRIPMERSEQAEGEQEGISSPMGLPIAGVIMPDSYLNMDDEENVAIVDYSGILYLLVILTLVNILLTLININRNRK